MTPSLPDLEQQREVIAQRIAQLGDLRPGSITSTTGRCGKPDCRCHQPGEPGHGPNFRLTSKVNGKPVSEALSTPAAIHACGDPRLRRSRRRSEKSRNSGNSNSLLVSFWEPVRRSVVCGQLRRRPRRSGKKNGRSDPARDHARSRAVLTDSVRGSAQEGAAGSGGDRDGYALGVAPRGCRRLEPAARISGPRRRRAHATLFLRPTSPLPRAAQQARADGLGVGGSFASLLFVRALWPRAISRGRLTGYREYGILSRSTPHASHGWAGGTV